MMFYLQNLDFAFTFVFKSVETTILLDCQEIAFLSIFCMFYVAFKSWSNNFVQLYVHVLQFQLICLISQNDVCMLYLWEQ